MAMRRDIVFKVYPARDGKAGTNWQHSDGKLDLSQAPNWELTHLKQLVMDFEARFNYVPSDEREVAGGRRALKKFWYVGLFQLLSCPVPRHAVHALVTTLIIATNFSPASQARPPVSFGEGP